MPGDFTDKLVNNKRGGSGSELDKLIAACPAVAGTTPIERDAMMLHEQLRDALHKHAVRQGQFASVDSINVFETSPATWIVLIAAAADRRKLEQRLLAAGATILGLREDLTKLELQVKALSDRVLEHPQGFPPEA